MRRFTGLRQLVHDTVAITTDLVEDTSESAAASTMRILDRTPIAGPARFVDGVRKVVARGVYGGIHGVNTIVSRVSDLGQKGLAAKQEAPPKVVPLRSDCTGRGPWLEDAAIGALNGLVGDFLHARGNALDLGMDLRLGDAYVEPEDVDAPRIALFIHGVGTTEWSWCLSAETYHQDPAATFGKMLAHDFGYVPVYLRYNSGRHVSENGRQLAELIDRIPCEELVLVGHSMGGLVARSACYYGQQAKCSWTASLSHVFCLGTPHEGAPLEKAGNILTSVLNLVDRPGTKVPAKVLNARSAGIKDLRYGYLIDEDWKGRSADEFLSDNREDVSLLDGVTYGFIGTTVTEDPDHPLGTLLGDLMVRRRSASGRVVVEQGSFAVEAEEVGGVLHAEIQNHPDVYQRIFATLSKRTPP
ncbi:MAG: alpha/beta fold hydrolase, partial [Deltaproteobacteria bacterium]|nr:alpha/beta fold hydrolase [Deltaproteobacteria bacterium]